MMFVIFSVIYICVFQWKTLSTSGAARRPILSFCKLAAIYENIDNYLVLTLTEKHPNWRVPQLAVLGMAGVGKSTLLERLLLCSVFPCRNPPNETNDEKACSDGGDGDCGEYTYVPLHIKLRHVHRNIASAMPPVVIRVIDTHKKVGSHKSSLISLISHFLID